MAKRSRQRTCLGGGAGAVGAGDEGIETGSDELLGAEREEAHLSAETVRPSELTEDDLAIVVGAIIFGGVAHEHR